MKDGFMCSNPYVSSIFRTWSMNRVLWGGFWVLVEKRTSVLLTSVSSKPRNCSWDLSFVLLPGVADILNNCLLLFVHMPLWKNMFLPCAACLPHVACPCQYTLYTCEPPLNPQRINYLMLWIKLAVAWDFSPPHLLAPFSQVPPSLEMKTQHHTD